LIGHAEIARFKDLDDLLLALLGRDRELDLAFRDAGLSGCISGDSNGNYLSAALNRSIAWGALSP
jgi:hypothetical protein